jgi:hypothetical protein
MTRPHVPVAAGLAALAAGALALGGCESTQDRSARIKREGRAKLSQVKGLTVTRANPSVKVVSTTTLRDSNGSAVVVRMRNVGSSAFVRLPVAVQVLDAAGKPLYRNDSPGLETSLVEAALLPARGELWWVNDQVSAAANPARATAQVGVSPRAAGAPPRIELQGVRLAVDPVDGISVKGMAVNHSKLDQRRLVIHCVAQRNGKIVAAGRAIIERLRPGKPLRFTIFFIGDPRGATLTLAAPSTTLTPGRS